MEQKMKNVLTILVLAIGVVAIVSAATATITGNVASIVSPGPKYILKVSLDEDNDFCVSYEIPKKFIFNTFGEYNSNLFRENWEFIAPQDSSDGASIYSSKLFFTGHDLIKGKDGVLRSTGCESLKNDFPYGDFGHVNYGITVLSSTGRVIGYGGFNLVCNLPYFAKNVEGTGDSEVIESSCSASELLWTNDLPSTEEPPKLVKTTLGISS